MNFRKPLLFINVLLSGLIVWATVGVFMTRASSEARKSPLQRDDASGRRQVEEQASRKAESQRVYHAIARNDMFGTSGTARKPPSPAPVKVSGLRLKLKGTVLGKNQEPYAVVLDERTRKQGLYRVNDVVQGARIARILADQVILKVRDGEEALVISYESTPGPRAGKTVVRKVAKVHRPPRKIPVSAVKMETEGIEARDKDTDEITEKDDQEEGKGENGADEGNRQ